MFNQRATNIIAKNTENLETFVDLLNEFETYLLESGINKEAPFRITDLLQFAKVRFSDRLPSIMCYLRGIFKYLYFFKKSSLLSLNK